MRDAKPIRPNPVNGVNGVDGVDAAMHDELSRVFTDLQHDKDSDIIVLAGAWLLAAMTAASSHALEVIPSPLGSDSRRGIPKASMI